MGYIGNSPDLNESVGLAQLDSSSLGNVVLTSDSEINQSGGSGTSNTAFGKNAGDSIASGGNYNVALGEGAGTAITTGDDNTVVGYAAGEAVVTGASNVFIGKDAGKTATSSNNVCIGESAGELFTGGDQNICIGAGAMEAADGSEDNCIAIGKGAMGTLNHETAASNIAIGTNAGQQMGAFANTHNLFIGRSAGGGTWTGAACTHNIAIGNLSLDAAMDGAVNNTCLGVNAGTAVTTGANNVFIGNLGGYTVTEGNNNIIIGKDSTTGAVDSTNAIVLGYSLTAASNDCVIGKTGTGNYITVDFDADATWDYSSDSRMKRNIQDDTLGLSFINDLTTKTFQWKPSEEFPEEWENWTYVKDADGNDTEDKIYPEMHERVMHGMIAQEVKSALDTAGIDTFAGWSEDAKGVQSLGIASFVIPLIKAVQELSAKITVLENA